MSASSQKALIRKNTNETYSLKIDYDSGSGTVLVEINADNYFGARHGLESLFQVMEYDDVKNQFIILSGIKIRDYPEFKHRGISLDTSRNFITVDVIKRIIDGMAHSKLNVLHWHIVDTHSFPIELKGPKVAQMTQYGAYDPQSIYTQKDIKDIVTYANYRGVRVIPELDQPAHVGNGWNFPGAEDFTVCVNVEPWYDYCVEPPCGQLNPSKQEIYDILEDLYEEFLDMFNFDSFHMGADEIHIGCWNTSDSIKRYLTDNGKGLEEADFIELWREFQEKSSGRLKKVAKNVPDMDIIVWTNHLTKPEYIHNLPKDIYTVQIWTDGSDTKDPQIKLLADKGYKMIFSNYDKTYLDCGYGAWVGEGNNWCSPYKGWQLQYGNDLYKMLTDRDVVLSEDVKEQVLGGEVNMWSEQTDSFSVEAKIFPRAAAFAERLWSNPNNKWYAAEQRMLHHRERLTQRGIRAEKLQPEWCLKNGGQCYWKDDDPTRPPDETQNEAEPEAESEAEAENAPVASADPLLPTFILATTTLVSLLMRL